MNSPKNSHNDNPKTHTRSGFLCWYTFVSRTRCLLSCLVFPALLLVLQAVARILLKINVTAHPVLTLLAGYFIYADFWAFGGSCSKDSVRAEYLKSSVRGTDFLRKALIYDCLVRFAVMALVSVLSVLEEWYFPVPLSGGCVISAGEVFLQTTERLLTAYAVSTLCILLERHAIDMTWYLCIGSQGIFLLALVNIFLLDSHTIPQGLLLVPAAVCSVLVSAWNVKKVIKKVEESCYDKTSEI